MGTPRQLLRKRMKLKQQKEKEKHELQQQQCNNNNNDNIIKIISLNDGIIEIYDNIDNNNGKLGHIEPCTHATIFSGLFAIYGISIKTQQNQEEQEQEENNPTTNNKTTTKQSKSISSTKITLSNGLTLNSNNKKEAIDI